MFTVFDVVRNKAILAGARGWIEQLPDAVGALADEWEFTPIRPLEGGTESFVLEVSLADATTAVLKLLIPRGIGTGRE